MTNITFLGTGCMMPTKARNHAGVLLTYNKENILFDCGEGTQRQIRIAGIKPSKINRLCISHFHGDHVFGIAGLMSSMGSDEYAKKLKIYGPVGTKKFLENLWKSFCAKDIIDHEVFEIKKGGVFYESDDFYLEAERLDHSVPCIGFRFVEKDKLRINVSKAEKLGLKGPILGKLSDGEDVTVDGKLIKSKDVTRLERGKSVAYVTDTTICDGVNYLANETDLLIIESTLLDDLRRNAKKTKHLTVKQAALIANENNVGKLVLTHISQRYKNDSEILAEASNYFNDVVVAKDFMKLKL
jgi:ribonuclease Z